ncbi:hypothetical protein V7111_15290 [Neobacillus niacini]|uniref:hypothetical protein n=1 Tax=Neobacillus niacini TaxID=86668 RepID=UPI003002303E
MEKEKYRHHQNPEDHFSRMMFGNRSEDMRTTPHKVSDSNPSSINLEAIFDNIEKLKESSQNLKPLVQMVYPFVERFLNKK